MRSERLFYNRIREMTAVRSPTQYHCVLDSTASRLVAVTPDELQHHIAGRHEFAFVTTGHACINTPHNTISLARGDLLLIGPGVDHVELPAHPPRHYSMCWCIVDHSYAMLSHTAFTPPKSYLSGATLELQGRTNVQNLAVAIGSELTTRDWGWQQSAQALLQYLGCILLRRLRRGQSRHLTPSESPTIAHDPKGWEVVQNALEYCRANFLKGVPVAKVAGAVGYSSSRLSHLFSSYLGESVADHIRRLRLAYASHLLEDTEYTIADIARRIGYSDPAHFTRAFVRTYHLSPNAFRHQLRGH